jgi:FkbM family methyltransferase
MSESHAINVKPHFHVPGQWTLGLFRKYGPCLTWLSVLRLRSAIARGTPTVDLTIRRPYRLQVTIRTDTSDLWGIKETFLDAAYQIVTDAIPRCRTVIDLGANAGLAALYFTGAYPGVRILAVEPVPETAAILTRNLGPGIRAGRHQVLPCAVWSSDEPVALVQERAPDAFTYVQTRAAGAADARQPRAQGRTMRQLLDASGFPVVDLLKIDIEGAEREVFKGDLGWLDRVKAIAIEFHDSSREEIGFDDLMARHGFTVLAENCHTVVASREPRLPSFAA